MCFEFSVLVLLCIEVLYVAISIFNHFLVLYTSEHDLADEFVATDGVEVHNDDLECTVPDLLPRHLKLKRLEIGGLIVYNAISLS
jgi:hypothetical protein